MNTFNSHKYTLNSCSDPWQTSEPKSGNESQFYPILKEPHPLISPAGKVEAKQLTSSVTKPIEVLLQEWLKLKIQQTQPLVQQWLEALALLYWFETQPLKIN